LRGASADLRRLRQAAVGGDLGGVVRGRQLDGLLVVKELSRKPSSFNAFNACWMVAFAAPYRSTSRAVDGSCVPGLSSPRMMRSRSSAAIRWCRGLTSRV
jgi:hypothetical protein